MFLNFLKIGLPKEEKCPEFAKMKWPVFSQLLDNQKLHLNHKLRKALFFAFQTLLLHKS